MKGEIIQEDRRYFLFKTVPSILALGTASFFVGNIFYDWFFPSRSVDYILKKVARKDIYQGDSFWSGIKNMNYLSGINHCDMGLNVTVVAKPVNGGGKILRATTKLTKEDRTKNPPMYWVTLEKKFPYLPTPRILEENAFSFLDECKEHYQPKANFFDRIQWRRLLAEASVLR